VYPIDLLKLYQLCRFCWVRKSNFLFCSHYSYRNGRSLGDAFTDLTIGRGYAYFPAVSLSMAENVHVNFGGTPLRFPISGYRALQDPPIAEVQSANLLISFIDRLVMLFAQYQSSSSVNVMFYGCTSLWKCFIAENSCLLCWL